MDPASRPETNPASTPLLPSTDEVVARLERLWGHAPLQAGWDPEVRGLRLGRYQLCELRGQGAFGLVYLARDTQLARDVALKAPHPQVLADAEKRRRFEAEAATAALLDHPGIVTIYEAELLAPTPYIVSAFCNGPDLGAWLADHRGPVPWREAAAFVAQIAAAVDYAHQRGVYHRDLKPTNIMLAPIGDSPHLVSAAADQTNSQSRTTSFGKVAASGEIGAGPLANQYGPLSEYQPKITDFGLARVDQAAAAETRSSLLLGTPLYMAPEQFAADRSAPPAAADIYSLGCLLYELTTGRTPIEGETYLEILDRLRTTPPAPLRTWQPDVPKDFERLVATCLEKNPRARYPTAGALAADLQACLASQPLAAHEVSWWSRLSYWCTRPQRIRDAGWYTLCVQVLLIVWVGIALVVGCYLLGVPRREMLGMAGEAVVLFSLVNGPMAVAAWYTLRHRPWAIYAGLGLSIFNVVVPLVFMALSVKPFFAGLYARVDSVSYHAFAICSLIFFAEAGQILLYAAAVAAWRTLSKR